MEAIYTWKDFLEAVCTYNKWAEGANEPAFLGDSDVKIKAMTVVGMMANVKVETLHWTACKESQPKNKVPFVACLSALGPFLADLAQQDVDSPTEERLSLPDGSCPCHTDPEFVGGCSSGTTDHYNSVSLAVESVVRVL